MTKSAAMGHHETTISSTLDAIRAQEPKLNAVVRMLDETAMASARHCDALSSSNSSAGPLQGLPFVIKDIIDFGGEPTQSGSLTCADNQPVDADAPVVAALRGAGAIPVAKTHTVEFAIGGWGTNQTVGTPVNPWDLETHRVPGGSSSGTGVLVGGGLVPAGLGTDTGGSVRIPAAFCGCVGHKSSIGLVSRAGVTPLSDTLDTVGPLTDSVERAAKMLAVMQGPDISDPTTLGVDAKCPLRDLNRGIQGLRLAQIKMEHMPHLTETLRRLSTRRWPSCAKQAPRSRMSNCLSRSTNTNISAALFRRPRAMRPMPTLSTTRAPNWQHPIECAWREAAR